MADKNMKKKAEQRFVTLRSNAPYPVQVTYNGEETFVPPFGKLENVDRTLLGDLPKSVRIVKA